MAGSYDHVNPDENGAWSLIENMGDAHECVEQLLFLVRYFATEGEIQGALEVFSQFRLGRQITDSNDSKAYVDSQRVMES